MSKSTHTKLSPATLKAYAEGRLTPVQQHEVEKALLKHPLEADALEGYEALQADAVKVAPALNDLQARLRQRISTPQERKIVPLWRYSAVAASVVVLLISSYFLFRGGSAADAPLLESAPESAAATAPPEGGQAITIPQTELKKIDSSALAYTPKPKKLNAPKATLSPAENGDVKESASYAEALPPVADSESAKKEEAIVSQPAEPKPSAAPPAAAAPMLSKTLVAKPQLDSMLVGQVVNEQGIPLAGVTVMLKGSTRGTATDAEGKFRLSKYNVGDKLMLNFIGYEGAEKAVNQSDLGKIMLKPDTKALSEVVVTSTDKTSKKEALGASDMAMMNLPQEPADFDKYLVNNLKKPTQAVEKGVSGEVFVEFMVNADGSLSDFKIIGSVGAGCDEEAIRLLKEGPRWRPSSQNGRPVRHAMRKRIVFN
ncbi:MAG: TonB family protein [Spirosomataceae bacterium]